MAARLKQDLDVEADIVAGRRGEFSVWVDDRKVAEKTWSGFPADSDVVEAVRKARAG